METPERSLWALRRPSHIVTLSFQNIYKTKQYAIWKWWNVRNAANAGEKLLLTSEITSFVRYMAMEACRRGELVSNPIVGRCGWSPPPDADGLLKINIDGAFIPASTMGCWGFIIRGH